MTATQALSETIELAKNLISRRSVTPEDAGCQEVIAERLKACGFTTERMPFGAVQNLWARRGTAQPLFVFAGHTDVVPPGPDYSWKHSPYKGVVENGILIGRGAADMKSAIAAMTTAVERFVTAHPDHPGSIAFLLTSNEEGDAVGGTPAVVETLQKRNEKIDLCIVGEATASSTVADTMKNGRRGSLTCQLKIKGQQGHVAYPDRAANPIHLFGPALVELCSQKWDDGNQFFTPTTMQISNVNSGTGADNVIPGELDTIFNFRFSSELAAKTIQERVERLLSKHGLKFDATWRLSGEPFLTAPGTLTKAASRAVQDITGKTPSLSTTGGTSDARFIAPTGAQVIELGLVNESIHKVNEQASVADIDALSRIYERIVELLLLDNAAT
jgi:succinyl-diaminopimelate desuccinylase